MGSLRRIVFLSAVWIKSAGSSAARSYPVSLVYSGAYYWSDSTLDFQNNYGNWWSKTPLVDNSNGALNLHVSQVVLYPSYSGFIKTHGFSLRCVNLYDSTSTRSYQMFLMSFDKLFVQGEYYYSYISLRQSSK